MINIIKNITKFFYFKKKGVNLTLRQCNKISKNVKFGKCVIVGKNTIVKNDVKIGDYSYINSGSRIIYADIGRFCSIGYDCLLGPEEHPIQTLIMHPVIYDKHYKYIKNKECINFNDKEKGKVIIKDNVWIGAKATILQGITIGEGAVIASNSVVTKDVLPYTIVGGVPASFIKNRKDFYSIKDVNLENMSTEEIVNGIENGLFINV